MCELDCDLYGTCINQTCVCPSSYGGLGEGVSLNSCHLDESVVNIVWDVSLGGSALVVAVSSCLLFRWLQGGGIDWAKLFTNRNFILLGGVWFIGVFVGLTAVVRLFASSLAFNDPAGTIFYFIAQTWTLVQCVPMVEMCHDTLVGMLKALGCSGTIPERGKWVRPIYIGFSTVPFIPILVSPALDTAGRTAMVQYYLLVLTLVVAVHIITLCIEGEQALSLLSLAGTKPSISARRRIRLLLLNFYLNGTGVMICNTLILFNWRYFPYHIAGYCVLTPLGCFASVLGLHYDRPIPAPSTKKLTGVPTQDEEAQEPPRVEAP